MENFFPSIDPTMYNFNKEFAYALTQQISGYNPKNYLVSFQFRTFEENALLFFTANPKSHDYIAIFLKDGYVHFECFFGYSSTSQLIVSPERMNNGAWVRLRAERENDFSVLQLNSQTLDSQLAPGVRATLDLSNTQLYFGGVVESFNKANYGNVVFKSFFGCMNSPQLDTTPVSLLSIRSFGIAPGCLDKPIRVASFIGDGFIELNGHPLMEDSMEFSFTFKTLQKSGVILLSTFEKIDRSKEEVSNIFFLN